MPSACLVLVAVLLTGCASSVSSASAQRVTFGLIGDVGYLPEEEPGVENLMADLNRDTGLAFVVHVGDLSSPRYACTDEMLARRLAQFRASAHPLVFTPGDNDWTDCHDPGVPGGNPLARLDKVRATFFPGNQALGQRALPLARQSDDPAFARYRENVRWDLGGVTFLTLHVPGSNNGRGRAADGDAEWAERNQANLAWMRQGFAHARTAGSRAVMILQQANIFSEITPIADPPKHPSGYTDLLGELERQTVAFGKPVVLVHGDSHYFRVDKPLSPLRVRGRPPVTALENFTRVETFGSPYSHWVHVTVDAGDPSVFTFRPRIVGANVKPRP